MASLVSRLAFRGTPHSFRAANEPCSRVDVQLAGRGEAIQSEFPIFDQVAVSNFDLGGYELLKMLVDVPLDGVASIDPRADLPEHLVPGPSDLGMQVAPQRRQVFIQLAVAIPDAHAEVRWPVETVAQAQSARFEVLRASRPLDDDFVHI
jgi:hypothetical protein